MGSPKVFILVLLLSFESNAIRFAITHWNDVSGQLESYTKGTSDSSAAPTPCPINSTTCIGGLVNMAHWIHENSAFAGIHADNILRLSSGNLIGGESGWLSSLTDGWSAFGTLASDFYMPHAMALGMKEFGAGLPRTLNFIDTLGVTNVTLCNACAGDYSGPGMDLEKKLCDTVPKIKKISLFNPETSTRYPIGVVGFVTPTVERLSLPGKLKFSPIVTAVQAAVNQNIGEIKTFIAIGDGNLETAKQILDNVPQVKLVLYGMGFGNSKNMEGAYPMKYNNKFIATAGRYGSTVGKLVFDITNSGDLSLISGKLIQTTYPQPLEGIGAEALKKFNPLLADVNSERKDPPVGYTGVTLQGGEICWRQECNLGNLVTDAMVHCAISRSALPFKNPLHAIWHGGAFFEDSIKPMQKIYKFDIHKWLPYHNRVHLVYTTGTKLKQVFRTSASGIDPDKAGAKDWRQFLQVSNGMEVYYSTRSGAPTLENIRMVHDVNGIPQLSDVIEESVYYLVIPTYLYEGRGVYEFAGVPKFWEDVFINDTLSNFAFDDECLAGYIDAVNHVTTGFEERIWINGGPNNRPSVDCKGSNTAVTVILTIVFFTIFIAIIYVGYFYVIPRLRTQNTEYPPNQL
ncbi:unnamed protein product [Orchesella dallaii]|uniref:5'-nucleotidase n=1 Tax=Orchesella dallaii TaxID=48710 RepID=A0ABP1Q9U8_9HEXA